MKEKIQKKKRYMAALQIVRIKYNSHVNDVETMSQKIKNEMENELL
ncbi:hypothetical protein ABI817_002743 [Bacillus cereus]|nr:hypothetical protein [Bacillus cereus]